MARIRDATEGVLAHGTAPHYLIEKIVRLKIYDSPYWKEQCFGLTAATLAQRAAKITYACGTYGGNQKPSRFMCLLLKMLLILPEPDIVLVYLQNKSLKYLTLLAAVYIRLTYPSHQVYELLEPFLGDYRKVRIRLSDGRFTILHIDEVVDSLLTETFYWSISLPRLTIRSALTSKLGVRKSRLSELDAELVGSVPECS